MIKKEKKTSFLKVLMSALAIQILVACSSIFSLPLEYEVKGAADKQLNLDASGRPLSLVVRTYQLKEKQEFSKLTYEIISSGRQESELLGAELNAQVSEYVLVPEMPHRSKEEWKPGTKYIGIVGFFRSPDANAWRFLLDAEQVRKYGLSFVAKNCYLSMTSPGVVLIPGQPKDMHPECASQQAIGIVAKPAVKR